MPTKYYQGETNEQAAPQRHDDLTLTEISSEKYFSELEIKKIKLNSSCNSPSFSSNKANTLIESEI